MDFESVFRAEGYVMSSIFKGGGGNDLAERISEQAVQMRAGVLLVPGHMNECDFKTCFKQRVGNHIARTCWIVALKLGQNNIGTAVAR